MTKGVQGLKKSIIAVVTANATEIIAENITG